MMSLDLIEKQQVRRNRLLSGSCRELVLLAPLAAAVPPHFANIYTDPHRYEGLIRDMQELRGMVYLKDQAIRPDQLTEGRHRQDVDEGSWHLLVLDPERRVCGCARYREYPHEADFSQLGVSKSALAGCSQWGDHLRSSVEGERCLSRQLRLPYVELGGWALQKEVRLTSEALRMALLTYCLSQALGGGVGITTATHRNGSASILRKIGGRPLAHREGELPSYHDPQYGCQMEVLRFYSWAPDPRYSGWIAELKHKLRTIPVFTREAKPGPACLSSPSWANPTVLPPDSRSVVIDGLPESDMTRPDPDVRWRDATIASWN